MCSQESGDLELKEGQRVLVIERTSNDWCVSSFRSDRHLHIVECLPFRWTGEFDGKKGLFPASYVKLL